MARATSEAPSLELSGAQARDLDRVLERIHRAVIRVADRSEQTSARLLGLDPKRAQGVGQTLLGGVLEDFTTADLSTADLAGVDLYGMLWSTWGTRWPEPFDVERLKSRSRELDPGTGVYLVERPAPSSTNSDVPTSV